MTPVLRFRTSSTRRASIRSIRNSEALSARLAKLFHPAAQHAVVRLLKIEKLNAHADTRLDNAHRSKRFKFLVFPCQGDADTRVGGQRLAGANENPAHGEVRGYTFRFCASFQIQDDHVGGKGI